MERGGRREREPNQRFAGSRTGTQQRKHHAVIRGAVLRHRSPLSYAPTPRLCFSAFTVYITLLAAALTPCGSSRIPLIVSLYCFCPFFSLLLLALSPPFPGSWYVRVMLRSNTIKL